MTTLQYTKHERIMLKSDPRFNEQWLQQCIHDDPTILGLGEVIVLDRERVQEKAGRLDLLLADPEQTRRYEVELMLGKTDESHIIRCISTGTSSDGGIPVTSIARCWSLRTSPAGSSTCCPCSRGRCRSSRFRWPRSKSANTSCSISFACSISDSSDETIKRRRSWRLLGVK